MLYHINEIGLDRILFRIFACICLIGFALIKMSKARASTVVYAACRCGLGLMLFFKNLAEL